MTLGTFLLALIMVAFSGPLLGAANPEGFSYTEYGKLLKAYVDDRGMVDYRGMKANHTALDDFIASASRLDRETFDRWNDEEKIAFWINVYNALTLKAIIDHYPIRPSFLKSFVYPKNSIRQIPGVWEKLKFPVMNGDITLDDIEHGMLRAKFHEPRIHMALVCAAMGCPPLRNEPFTAAKLDAQLDDQSSRFLRDPKKFLIDRTTRVVRLSPIFEWFGDDFREKYGGKDHIPGVSARERAALNFVSQYLDSHDRAYLMKGGFSVTYAQYDWSLNENTR
jgi:hypothetical protein